MPSEASVKFFDETFFQKSFDLALDLSGRQPEKKLGKQRSVFPDRRSASAVNSRLGAVSYAHACANHRCTCAPGAGCPLRPPLEGTLACRLGQALNGAHWAPAPPKGGGETWLCASFMAAHLLGSPLGGRYVPVGRCPAADRGGSRDAGTASAVTERASGHWLARSCPRAEDREMRQLPKKPGFMRVSQSISYETQ